MNSEPTTSTPTAATTTQSSPSSPNPETSTQTNFTGSNSLASDGPLLALLRKFPRGFSTIAEGQEYVRTLQALRLNPMTLRAKLQEESNEIEKRTPKRQKVTKAKVSMDDVLKGLL